MKTQSRSEAEEAFREAVKRRREERGMTQTQVGRLGGRSQGVVSRYLKARMRLPDDVVRNLAEQLDLADEAAHVFASLPDAIVSALRSRRWSAAVPAIVAVDKAFQRRIEKLSAKDEPAAAAAAIEHLEGIERGLRAGLRH